MCVEAKGSTLSIDPQTSSTLFFRYTFPLMLGAHQEGETGLAVGPRKPLYTSQHGDYKCTSCLPVLCEF